MIYFFIVVIIHNGLDVKSELEIILPKISQNEVVIAHDSCKRTQSGSFRAFNELDNWHVFFIDSNNDQGTVSSKRY